MYNFRKTGQKKKLNTYIEFPEVIDLSAYLDQKGKHQKLRVIVWYCAGEPRILFNFIDQPSSENATVNEIYSSSDLIPYCCLLVWNS